MGPLLPPPSASFYLSVIYEKKHVNGKTLDKIFEHKNILSMAEI
jgi:hypothetical protein